MRFYSNKLMIRSLFKQLQSLNDRLQAAGFCWHHDDYFCLKEALPEIIANFTPSKANPTRSKVKIPTNK